MANENWYLVRLIDRSIIAGPMTRKKAVGRFISDPQRLDAADLADVSRLGPMFAGLGCWPSNDLADPGPGKMRQSVAAAAHATNPTVVCTPVDVDRPLAPFKSDRRQEARRIGREKVLDWVAVGNQTKVAAARDNLAAIIAAIDAAADSPAVAAISMNGWPE